VDPVSTIVGALAAGVSEKYRVDLRGARGVQVGDGNEQMNVFRMPPARP